MVTRDGLMAILTESTCADPCWYAREDVCRCSCGGRNHGVLLQDGAERPARTKKVGRYRFQLVGIAINHHGAIDAVRELYDAIGERRPASDSLRPGWGEPGRYCSAGATEREADKWPELEPYRDWYKLQPGEAPINAHDRRPYLIWERVN